VPRQQKTRRPPRPHKARELSAGRLSSLRTNLHGNRDISIASLPAVAPCEQPHGSPSRLSLSLSEALYLANRRESGDALADDSAAQIALWRAYWAAAAHGVKRRSWFFATRSIMNFAHPLARAWKKFSKSWRPPTGPHW
jgi:hypothetical protein